MILDKIEIFDYTFCALRSIEFISTLIIRDCYLHTTDISAFKCFLSKWAYLMENLEFNSQHNHYTWTRIINYVNGLITKFQNLKRYTFALAFGHQENQSYKFLKSSRSLRIVQVIELVSTNHVNTDFHFRRMDRIKGSMPKQLTNLKYSQVNTDHVY